MATTLNEIAEQSGVGIRLFEEALPVRGDVLGACEVLGLDPLYVANEGKVLVSFRPRRRRRAFGHEDPSARKIFLPFGEVVADDPGRVLLRTRIGGCRIVDMLRGEQLPRIC